MTTREDAITRVVTEAKANPKGGEAKALLEVLGPDEIPERAVKGFYGGGNGLLVATDRRVVFVDKGLVGLRVEEFPYNKISSITPAFASTIPTSLKCCLFLFLKLEISEVFPEK